MKWTAYIWSLKLIKFTSRLCGSRSQKQSPWDTNTCEHFFLKEILQETKQQPRGNKNLSGLASSSQERKGFWDPERRKEWQCWLMLCVSLYMELEICVC